MNQTIYLDNNATTKTDEEVYQTMIPYLKEEYGNPSSIYSFGRTNKDAINNARYSIAKMINACDDNIMLTSGGSESNVTAIMSSLKYNPLKKHIITTKVEHVSVLETMKYLEQNGY